MDGSADRLARRSRVFQAAQLIAPACDPGEGGRASFVATTFTHDGEGPATLRISAQGVYRAHINGRRVGADYLTPGWTCYDDRIDAQSYEVGDLLRPGENRIVIEIADGWYRSPIMWREKGIPNCWGDRIGAVAEIETGGRIVLATGPDWQSGLLPVTRAGIYYGEDHDARLEGEAASAGTEALDTDMGLFVPAECDPVKALDPIAPVRHWTDPEGRMVVDFGQNMAGFVEVEVEGEAGASLYIDHAEVTGPDGEIDRRNYRVARAALRYTLRGEGREAWAPAFTFMGFRYARIAIEGNATLHDIRAVPISSVPERAGGIETGEGAVNRLVLNTLWSQRANFIEVPTDCPQRDERLGWTGDAQVFAGTACWLADSERFLRKYLRDVMHDQRPDGAVPHFSPDPTRLHPAGFDGDWAGSTGWGDVITVMPWQLYLHYGDDAVLRECFPAMRRWLDYLWSISDGPIIRPHSVWGAKGFTFGDWLQPTGDNRKPRPTIGDDCAATLYHYISTDLAARIATVIGEDPAPFRRRAEEIRTAFQAEYFTATGRMAHNDQTSYALAFLHDLVPAEHCEAAKGYFRRAIEDLDHVIGTGFIGTPALLPALTKLGLDDLAEKVFLNRDVPGWLYQVEQGATTIWERWDAIGPDGTIYEPSMNSYNHYAYGAVCQWLFEEVAGVTPRPEAPGFDEVDLDPAILPALAPVAMWHTCRHGRIEAGWRIEDARVIYTLTLPDGVTGRLRPSPGRPNVTLDGAPVEVPRDGLAVPGGVHEITFDRII